MSYHERPHELGPTICAEGPALSDFPDEADREARLCGGKALKESLSGDWNEKSTMEKYASRLNRAVTQYRRERAVSLAWNSRQREALAYAELQAEQQRAIREFVTCEYRRLATFRDAPHREPVQRHAFAPI